MSRMKEHHQMGCLNLSDTSCSSYEEVDISSESLRDKYARQSKTNPSHRNTGHLPRRKSFDGPTKKKLPSGNILETHPSLPSDVKSLSYRYTSAEASALNALRSTERETVSLKRKLCQMKRSSQQDDNSGMERMDFSVERVTELPKYVQVLPFVEEETSIEAFSSGEEASLKTKTKKKVQTNECVKDEITGGYYTTGFSQEQVVDLPKFVKVFPSIDENEKNEYKIKPVTSSEDEVYTGKDSWSKSDCNVYSKIVDPTLARIETLQKYVHVMPRLSEASSVLASNSNYGVYESGAVTVASEGREGKQKGTNGDVSWESRSSFPIYMNKPPSNITEIREGKYKGKPSSSSERKSNVVGETRSRSRDSYANNNESTGRYNQHCFSQTNANNLPVFMLPNIGLSNTVFDGNHAQRQMGPTVLPPPQQNMKQFPSKHDEYSTLWITTSATDYSLGSCLNSTTSKKNAQVVPNINEMLTQRKLLNPKTSVIYESNTSNKICQPKSNVEADSAEKIRKKQGAETSSDGYDTPNSSFTFQSCVTPPPINAFNKKSPISTLKINKDKNKVYKMKHLDADVDDSQNYDKTQYSGDVSSTVVTEEIDQSSTSYDSVCTGTLDRSTVMTNDEGMICADIFRCDNDSDGYDKVDETSGTAFYSQEIKELHEAKIGKDMCTQTDSSESSDATLNTKNHVNIYKGTIKRTANSSFMHIMKPKTFNDVGTQKSSFSSECVEDQISNTNDGLRRDCDESLILEGRNSIINNRHENLKTEKNKPKCNEPFVYSYRSLVSSSYYSDAAYTPYSSNDHITLNTPPSSTISSVKYQEEVAKLPSPASFSRMFDEEELLCPEQNVAKDLIIDIEDTLDRSGSGESRSLHTTHGQLVGHFGLHRHDVYLDKWGMPSRAQRRNPTEEEITTLYSREHTTFDEITKGKREEKSKLVEKPKPHVNLGYTQLLSGNRPNIPPPSVPLQEKCEQNVIPNECVRVDNTEGLRPTWKVDNSPMTFEEHTEKLSPSWKETDVNEVSLITDCEDSISVFMQKYNYLSEEEEMEHKIMNRSREKERSSFVDNLIESMSVRVCPDEDRFNQTALKEDKSLLNQIQEHWCSERSETGRFETERTEVCMSFEAGRFETERTEVGKCETGRFEKATTETGRFETARTETGRTETGRSEKATIETGRSEAKRSELNLPLPINSTKVKENSEDVYQNDSSYRMEPNKSEFVDEFRIPMPRQERPRREVSPERRSIFQRLRIPGLSPRRKEKKSPPREPRHHRHHHRAAEHHRHTSGQRRNDVRIPITDESPDKKRKWFQKWRRCGRTESQGIDPRQSPVGSSDYYQSIDSTSIKEFYVNPPSTGAGIINQDSKSRLGLIDPSFYEIKPLQSEYDMEEGTSS